MEYISSAFMMFKFKFTRLHETAAPKELVWLKNKIYVLSMKIPRGNF